MLKSSYKAYDKFFNSLIKILKQEYKKWRKPIVTAIAKKRKDPFKVLISTLLSLRTKDEVTSQAFGRLFALAQDPKGLAGLPLKKIIKAIYPVGFYRTKAKNIKTICKILLEKYHSSVPHTMEALLSLKGVGRKTANLVLTRGFGLPGICVDTHVHRISNRLGILKTKNPDETEMRLREILPKRYWIIYNDLLVAYGQNLCRPVAPLCTTCKITNLCQRVSVTKFR